MSSLNISRQSSFLHRSSSKFFHGIENTILRRSISASHIRITETSKAMLRSSPIHKSFSALTIHFNEATLHSRSPIVIQSPKVATAKGERKYKISVPGYDIDISEKDLKNFKANKKGNTFKTLTDSLLDCVHHKTVKVSSDENGVVSVGPVTSARVVAGVILAKAGYRSLEEYMSKKIKHGLKMDVIEDYLAQEKLINPTTKINQPKEAHPVIHSAKPVVKEKPVPAKSIDQEEVWIIGSEEDDTEDSKVIEEEISFVLKELRDGRFAVVETTRYSKSEPSRGSKTLFRSTSCEIEVK